MPGQENQPKSPLAGVLQKLEGYNPQVKPEEKILNMTDVFFHGLEENNKIQLNDALSSFKECGQGSLEHCQQTLAAYLFSVNRRLYQEGGGKNFDPEKEKRQIEAVVAALKGKHVHMGTGEGKSMVVLPVVSLVESLTSDKKDVIVATVNDTLLTEIKKRTENLAKYLPLGIEVTKYERPEIKDSIDDGLYRTMQKEALLDNQYSDKTKGQIQINYWTDQTTPMPKQKHGLPDATQEPRVVFMTERDLVFAASDDKAAFQKNAPRIFMDEADIPYNRSSPYQKVSESRFMTPEQIQNSAYQWLTNFMISRQLTEKDFEFSSGAYQPKAGLADKLTLDPKSSDSFFTEGVDLIAKKLGLNDQEKDHLFVKASTYLADNLPTNENLKDYAGAVGNLAAEITFLKNRHYVIDKKTGQIIVRDAYIDELLEKHRYEPEYQLAILALNNQFEIIDLYQPAYSSLKFPTFVSLAKDKLVCFSGTLLYPDPMTGRRKDSAFAKLLEDITLRSVVEITPPDPKTVPRPEFFDTNVIAEEKIISDLKDNLQPTLIIDYESVSHTEGLYKKIVAAFPDKKISLLKPKPSTPKEEIEYNEEVVKSTKQLAEGEIDMIVSSGTAGTGVNIVKNNGGFPNLHVSVFGMPENEMQLVQTIGRRRAPDNSFSWYLSQESMERFVSYYNSETASKLAIVLGKIDKHRIRELVEKSKNDPEKRLKVCLELLGEKHRHEVENDQTTIEFDVFFDKVSSLFQKQLVKILEKQGLPEKQKELFLNSYNAPGSLYFDILRESSLAPGTGDPKQFVQKLGQAILNKPTLDKKYDSLLSQWVSEWFETSKDRVKDFHDLVTFNEGISSEPPRQVVLIPLNKTTYQPVSSFSLPLSENKKVQPIAFTERGVQKIGAIVDGELRVASPVLNEEENKVFEQKGEIPALTYNQSLNMTFLPSSKPSTYLMFFKNK